MAATFLPSSRRSIRWPEFICRRNFATLGLLIFAAVLYGPVISKLVRQWWEDPDYSHALLVAPFAAFLMWQRRRALLASERQPSSWGLFIVVGSLALLVIGTLGAELYLTRISLLGCAAGAMVFLFGWRHLRLLAFPLTLVLLTIPIPAIVVSRLTLSLQFIASGFAEEALTALRIPVLREGNVLILPNATLQVAEACSGIRSLMALVTLALVIARFSESGRAGRAVIVAAAVPIAVLVNALRVSVAAVAAYWYGVVAVEGFIHEFQGWLMFLMALALMAACARAVGARMPQRPAWATR